MNAKVATNINRILKNAEEYPLIQRIASYLAANGVTEAEFQAHYQLNLKATPQPLLLSVQNALRDIEHGATPAPNELIKDL